MTIDPGVAAIAVGVIALAGGAVGSWWRGRTRWHPEQREAFAELFQRLDEAVDALLTSMDPAAHDNAVEGFSRQLHRVELIAPDRTREELKALSGSLATLHALRLSQVIQTQSDPGVVVPTSRPAEQFDEELGALGDRRAALMEAVRKHLGM